MTDHPIWQWSACDTAAAVRAGEISCGQAVEAALTRLEQANPAVNAVTLELADRARDAAARADRALAEGQAPGPLQGVPVTIKENVDQRGLSNPNGVPALAETVAEDDSPVVANLIKAGAIVIGRTNTPEFSLRWFTDNPLRGKTLNPWDPAVTPGGSSGGASAAAALGIGAIAHGNDLGGSLRYPAYACGLATIRPSLGRVPAYNPSAAAERPLMFQLMSVQGPIAREVRDLRLALAAMAAPDPRDPWWVPAPLEGPRPADPIRVALTKDPLGVGCHPAVSAALDQAASHLEAAGFAVVAVDPPALPEIAESWRRLLFTETQLFLEPTFRAHGSADFNAVFDGYRASLGGEPRLKQHILDQAARCGLLRAWARFQQDYPLVLAPVSQVPPFPQDEDLKGPARLRQMLDEQAVLYAVNFLGLPAAAVPTGLHEGVPIGVQIIGQRFREDLCLDAAQAIEDRVGLLARQLWDREATGA